MNSQTIQRIEDVKVLKERQFVEDASPMRHPIQPKSYISMNNFYTATVYEKGAEVIRMLYTLLGEKKFFDAMQIYFDRFDGKAVTTDDFLSCMQEVTDIDLSQFKLWYDQSGTPKLVVKESFKENEFVVEFMQEIPKTLDGKEQKPMMYPLNVALFDADGALLEEKQLLITKQSETISFGSFQQKPILSLNRNFSAPIILEQKEQNFSFLAAYETDGFSRYEACMEYAKQTIQKIYDTDEIDTKYLKFYSDLLDSQQEDLLFFALLLELPTINELIQNKKDIDIQKYHQSKEKLALTLAQQNEAKLKDLYKTYHQPQNNTLTKEAKGARAIKNYALMMLGYLKTDEIYNLAKKQYEESLNMGDKLTALKVADSIDHQKAGVLFDDFYQKYKDNSLLMVKYFAILASLDHEDIFPRLEDLENTEAFDIKVPNLVRGLFGAFSRNLAFFHTPKGYEYIAQKVIALDTINPQIASSLANSFRLYPKLQEENQKVIKDILEKVLQKEDISSNTYEVVSKILKG